MTKGISMKINYLTAFACLLLANIILGVFIFHHGMYLNYIDSVYFVTTIVTTIGFGDFNLATAPLGIKIYGIYLMLSGAGGYAVILSFAVDNLIKNKLLEITGKKRYFLENHVIICGFGRVGQKILDNLLLLEDSVLVIEKNEGSQIDLLKSRNIPYIIGDIRQTDTLNKASITKCKAIIFCTDNDLANLEGALTAHEISPNVRVVLRIYDQTLARKVQKGFQIKLVFSTSTIAAPTFAQAAHDENIICSTIIDNELFLTTKITIVCQSKLDGMTLGDLQIKLDVTVLILSKNNGKKIRFPNTAELLEGGDEVVITTNRDSYKVLKKLNNINFRK